MEYYLKNIFRVYMPAMLISLLFTVPLVSPSYMFNGAFFGKEFGFYIFVTILIIYTALFGIFRQTEGKISLNYIDIAFILFVLWNIVSLVITDNAIINNKIRELIFLSVFYFIVKGFLTDTENRRLIMIITSVVLLLVADIEAIVGLLQLYNIVPSNNPYFNITGTFHNPAPYSLFLAISFTYAFSVYALDVFKEKHVRYLSLVACIAVFLIIPFTANRASWIGIAAGIVFVIFMKYRRREKNIFKVNKLLRYGLAGLILVSAIIGTLFLYNLKKGSSDGRILIWKVSGNIIKEHPVTGIGYGRFNAEYNLYQADYFKGDHDKDEELLADNVRMAYNDYIEMTVETGIPGLLLFLALLYCIFHSLKLKQDFMDSLTAPLFVFLVLAFVSYPLNTVPTKIMFFFFAGTVSSEVNAAGKDLLRIKLNKFILLSLLIISVSFSFGQIRKYLKYKEWLYAYNALNNGQTEISEAYFGKIQKDLKHDLRFSVLYAECLYRNQKYDEVLKTLNEVKNIVPDPEMYLLMGNSYYKTNQYPEAIGCYEKANYMVPGRILPKYHLTKVYYDNGKTAKADSLAEMIFEMEIKIKSDTTQALINEIKEIYQKNKQPVEYARQGH